MNSQTSIVAAQTRLSQWADDIRDCQNRPAGMKIEEWCSIHHSGVRHQRGKLSVNLRFDRSDI